MSGFVDVSNMSSLEIKRLGQMDDNSDGYEPRFVPRAAAGIKFSVSDVWAAACAAQRVNGEYLKEGRNTYDSNGQILSTKRRNRDIMMEFLHNPDRLLVQDVERGEHCQQFLQNDLTFRTLKGKISDFDSAVRKVLAVSDHFDTHHHKYELAIAACLPASVSRSEERQKSDQRIQFANGGLIGNVNDKVTLNVEVLSANYSQQYNIYWIRAITDCQQPVFFSNKQKFDIGSVLAVKGTVKAHKDNLTQLNRVKVL